MPRWTPHPERRPAVVTGSSSGIGEATARALAQRGHPVVLGARRADRCEQIAKEIANAGGEAAAFELDVADPDSVEEFVDAARDAFGDLDVVVSNAGQSLVGSAAESHDRFAQQVDVNLNGAQRLLSRIVPGMIERRHGDVVFVTSESVEQPWPGLAGYVASKWGLEGLARVMQRELEGTGVRASIVRPGPTLTEMGWTWDRDRIEELLGGFKRWGVFRHAGLLRPEQVARAVVDVVSMPRGSHVTVVEVQPQAPVEGGPS